MTQSRVTTREGKRGATFVLTASPAIRCRGLAKRFGDVVAVAGLDLTVAPGECFGLLGPNGAGKTTTIEILEGLTPPDSGEVEILGTPWREGAEGRALRERLGIQLQETQLADKLTVAETLSLFRSFYRRSHTVDEVLALVELEEKRGARVVTLSGGQKQRLAVACALVSRPELLFLDEPTTGLDPQSRRQLWDVIRRFREAGGSVLLTTHYMEEAERLCDRVAIMDHGTVIALGTPRELIASLGADHVVDFALTDGSIPGDLVDVVRAMTGVTAVRTGGDGGGISLTVVELHRALPALLALLQQRGVELSLLTTHHPTLDDVFVALTGRQLRDT
ncbi:MAG: ABC transporter ATP-binding protein [Gemmatimonadales bacterium]